MKRFLVSFLHRFPFKGCCVQTSSKAKKTCRSCLLPDQVDKGLFTELRLSLLLCEDSFKKVKDSGVNFLQVNGIFQRCASWKKNKEKEDH